MENEKPSYKAEAADWNCDGRSDWGWETDENCWNSLHWRWPGQATSGAAGPSQAILDLAKKNRSALSLNSVRGRGVSCLWIRLPVFITSSCAGIEGRHTIPYPGLSVSGPGHLSHSIGLLQHWMEPWKNTQGSLPHIQPINGACP